MADLSNWPVVVDDTGTKRDGTRFNKSLTDAILASINAEVSSPTNPTVSLADLIDEIVDARGSEASLTDRLDISIGPDGSPVGSEGADVTGTAGENLAAGEACYLSIGLGGKTSGRWYRTDADFVYASFSAVAVGFAMDPIIAASSGLIRRAGRVTGLAGLTAGTKYYVAVAAGALTAVAPTNVRAVGVADSTTSLILFPDPTGERLCQTAIVDIGNVGVGEDTCISLTCGGGLLAEDTQQLVIIGWGTTSNANVVKKIRIYFGNAVFLFHNATNAATGTWQVCLIVIRTSANTQVCLCSAVGSGGAVTMLPDVGTAAEDLTADITIKITAEATNNNDIVNKGLLYKIIP